MRAWVRKLPLGDIEVLAQIQGERTLRLEGEAAAAYAIVDAPYAVGNSFAQMAEDDLEFRVFGG